MEFFNYYKILPTEDINHVQVTRTSVTHPPHQSTIAQTKSQPPPSHPPSSQPPRLQPTPWHKPLVPPLQWKLPLSQILLSYLVTKSTPIQDQLRKSNDRPVGSQEQLLLAGGNLWSQVPGQFFSGQHEPSSAFRGHPGAVGGADMAKKSSTLLNEFLEKKFSGGLEQPIIEKVRDFENCARQLDL